MKIEKQIDNTTYIYKENFITGKQELYINGECLQKTSKRTFKTQKGEIYNLDGGFFMGVTIEHKKQKITLYQNAWYENLIMYFPLILFIVSCFFGVIGAVLGCVFEFVSMVCCAQIFHTNLQKWLKIMLNILIILILTGLGIGIYFLI